MDKPKKKGTGRSFSSIKIVGISGVGKTSLVEAVLTKFNDLSHLSYGEYLASFGQQAQEKMSADLRKSTGLVLMDEHLEIDDFDLINSYLQENTIGIFIIEAEAAIICKRKTADDNRARCQETEQQVEFNQENSRLRAIRIASKLSIPLVIVRNSSLQGNLDMLVSFINSLGYTC